MPSSSASLLSHKTLRRGGGSATLWLSALTAASTGMLLGYDVGAMSDAILFIPDTVPMSTLQTEILVSSLNLLAAIGALVGGSVCDRLGRRPTIALCASLFLIGTFIFVASSSYAMLLSARVVMGVGVGISLVVGPTYISEIAPPARRGQMSFYYDCGCNVGILLGGSVGLIVYETCSGAAERWRWMIGAGAVLPVVILLALVRLPESPRWLVAQGRREDARAALAAVDGDGGGRDSDSDGDSDGGDDERIEATLRQVEATLEEAGSGDGDGSLVATLLRVDGPGARLLLLATMIGAAQQASGNEAVLYYSPLFLETAGLATPAQRMHGLILVYACKLAPEVLLSLVVDRVGRRPLLIASAAASALVLGALAALFACGAETGGAALALLCLDCAAFSLGLGPATWVVIPEILPLRLRASGVTLAAAANRLLSGAVALSALSIADGVGYVGLFALYALLAVATTLFYALCVPDASGLSLEAASAAQAGAAPRAAAASSDAEPVESGREKG